LRWDGKRRLLQRSTDASEASRCVVVGILHDAEPSYSIKASGAHEGRQHPAQAVLAAALSHIDVGPSVPGEHALPCALLFFALDDQHGGLGKIGQGRH
jgi:hypothetical protein